jgi:hypothetical protein
LIAINLCGAANLSLAEQLADAGLGTALRTTKRRLQVHCDELGLKACRRPKAR